MKARPSRYSEVERPAVIDPNQRYSLPEAFALLRISPQKGFRNMRLGRLQTFHDGGRTFVAGTELLRLSRAPKETGSGDDSHAR